MSQAASVQQLLEVFEKMTVAEQRRAMDALRDSHLEALKVAREIEIVGAYELSFEDESETKQALSPTEAIELAAIQNREVILAYLRSLPEEQLLRKYRVVQFRLLEDRSLWQVAACATIRREIGGWDTITGADIVPLRTHA